MTDPGVADVVYLEPLTVASVERILEIERPEGLLASLGGQTGLNLAMELARAGILARTETRLLGTPIEAIEMAEDRERFRDLLDRIGQPYAPSVIVEGRDDAERPRLRSVPWRPSACPPSSARRSRWAAPAAASWPRRRPTGSGCAPGCA